MEGNRRVEVAWKRIGLKLSYASLIVFACSLFVSFSFSALGHILLLFPGLYFISEVIKDKGFIHALSGSSLCLLLIILWSILSLLVNDIETRELIRSSLKLKYFLFGVLGIYAYEKVLAHRPDRVKFLLQAFLISTTLATLVGLWALKTGWNPLRFKAACHDERNCGMYGMYMTYGYGLGFFVLLLTGLILYREKIKNYCSLSLLYSAWAINLLGLVLSYCRGALIGLLAALPFFFLKKSKKVFLLVILCLVTGSGLLFVSSKKVQNLFLDSERLLSNQKRLSQMKTVWMVVKEKPLFGIGYRNFEPNVESIKRRHQIEHPEYSGHAHNNFLEHLASTGVMGFLLLLIFHILWAKESWQRQDWIGVMTLAIIVDLFVSGQFQYTLGDGENLFLLMLLYSFSQMNLPQDSENKEPIYEK